MKPTTWRGQARILAFIILSAWSLYVGGLLTARMDFVHALASIFVAYLIFVLLYTFYAGTKKGKDALFREAFGSTGARYFVSIVAVLGQVGWYAIVIEIGGTALTHLLGGARGGYLLPVAIVGYSALMVWVACGGTRRMDRMSVWGIPAMVLFSLWGAYAIFTRLGIYGILSYQPPAGTRAGLATGVELMLASFISFSVIVPDFLCSLKNKKEVSLASFWGLVPTTLFMGGLGAAFAIIGHDFDVIHTLTVMGGAWFTYLFLTVDNLSSGTALFPVGIGFANLGSAPPDSPQFETRRKLFTMIAGGVGAALAIMGVVGKLEGWLTILGIVFAPIMGVVLANQYVLRKDHSGKKLSVAAMASWIVGSLVSLIPYGIPILQALAASFIAFIVLEKIFASHS